MKRQRDPVRAPRRGRLLGPLLLLAALLPGATVAVRAFAGEDDEAGALDERYDDEGSASPWEMRRRVLSKIPTDPSVLINVTYAQMPASPDILNLGKRGTAALARCLSDNVDDGVRATCAMLLGSLGDRSALPALQAALEDWEPSVRNAVIRALAQIPDKTSVDPLIKLFRRKDEERWNRLVVLHALGTIGHPKAVTLLREELLRAPAKDGAKSGADLRADAFRALWMSRHLMARETLVGDVDKALRSDDAGLVVAATEAAAELRAPRLVGALIPLLESPDAEARNKAVYALGLIGDKTATKALLARLPGVRDARMLNNIAFALERLDRDAFYASIRKVIEHKQAVIRLNAAFVLGDVKRPEGLPMLFEALDDPSDYVKTSAVVALGKIGTKEAVARLRPLVDASNLTLREEAIYAIHAQGGAADLIHDKLFRTDNFGVQRRAALALGKAGDPRVRGYMLACLEQRSCATSDVEPFVRLDKDPAVAGRVLLAWARGREDLTDLVADLRPTGTLPIALSSIDAAMARQDLDEAERGIDLVGDLGEPSARARLEDKLANADTWLRIHTAIALVRLGDTDADTTVLREMDNLAAVRLPGLASALRRIEEPAARARLAPELDRRAKGADIELGLAAASVRLAWDPEAAIFRMLDALASPGARERELATIYLRKDRSQKVTWLLRRALARETREDVRDRLRGLLDGRPQG